MTFGLNRKWNDEMASEKVRTGLKQEVFVMGQMVNKLEGVPSDMQYRILNHLMLAASDAQETGGAAVDARREGLPFD